MLKSVTLQFTEHQDITLPASGINIFVGPNSSGKSLVLREVEQIFLGEQEKRHWRILKDFEVTWPSVADAEQEVLRLASMVSQPTHYPEGTYNLGAVTPNHGYAYTQVTHQNLRIIVGNRSDKDWWARSVLRWRVIRLDGRSRFQLTDDREAGDLQEPPNNSLSHLFRNDDARHRVQQLVHDAFGVHYVIDPTKLGTLRIRISSVPVLADEQSLSAQARDFYSQATHIKQASDGVQAFSGIATALHSGEFQTILIDEPEAFLHPPLARKMGKSLASLASEREGVLFAATHSADFLMGCLQGSRDVRVVRLEYSGGKSRGRMVDPGELAAFLEKPLMRSANVVSALFYDGVVVTESDNDRAFYSEIYHRLSKADSSAPSILFVNAQNKQTAKDIVGPLRKFGVPAAALVDLDVIKEGGKSWTEWLTSARVPSEAHAGLQSDRHGLKSAFDAAAINMKVFGVDALPAGQAAAAHDFFDRLDSYGFFVVRVGEMERWLLDLDVQGMKTEWTISMLHKLGVEEAESSYVPIGEQDVWGFMRRIVDWIRSPARKGLA